MKKIICFLLLLAASRSFSQTIVNDGKPIECATRFTAAIPGSVTGVKFFKGSDSSTYVVSLWDAAGNRLASNTVTGGASGYATIAFPLSIPILPSSTYAVSFYSPAGNYAGTPNYFGSPVASGAVTMTGGFYQYGAGFPINQYQKSFYYVEPVFSASMRDTVVIHDTLIVDPTTYNFYVPDSGGVFRDADSVTAYRAFFGVAPPHLRVKETAARVYRFTYSGYRITLYKSGAWIREKQINGVWTIVDTPLY